ncbi:MAG: Gfo/Idh/MocA family oxidoreductase [Thaumarchaeota archaeon]|nr:Gfo/Idh/MocA family oxidoreductase [Nitrososphaerota archaeon]
MENSKIGFGIVGVASHHSEFVAHAVRNIPGAFLVGAYDADESRAKWFCEKFQTPRFDDLDSLLQDPNVKIGAVTSENSRKKEYAVSVARAGKHVLCDKPLGVTARESREIIDACKKSRVVLQVGYISRYTMEARTAKRIIDSGKLGGVRFIDAENRVDNGLVKQLSPWLMKKELAGGGALMEHSVHAIDLALWLNGSYPVSVFAVSAENLDGATYEAEDNFAIMLKFKNKSIALIDGSYCRPSSGKRGDVVIKVHGSSKHLSFSLSSENLRAYVGEEPSGEIKFYPSETGGSSEEESGLKMIEDLLRSVKTRSEPLTNGAVGESVNRVVDACYASMASGREVPVR